MYQLTVLYEHKTTTVMAIAMATATAAATATHIIIHDNEKGTCTIIDAAISGDRNVIKKDAETILK
jgi:hypothetical protein